MLGLENQQEVIESTHADVTKMECSIKPTISPAAEVYASVTTAISEINNLQQNHEANFVTAAKR